MAETLTIEVVTPEKAVVSEEAQSVVAPGSMGEFGVLADHTPFLTSLKEGLLRYVDSSGQQKSVFVNGGFAEALPGKVTVLAESAELKEDIDVRRAEEAKDRAEKRLDVSSGEKVDTARAKAALARAIHRITIGSA